MQLPTPMQNYIHLSKYSRWDDSLGRREIWSETVERYIQFFINHLITDYPDSGAAEYLNEHVTDAILNLDVMPAMRCLMTAGPALARDNVAGFNCSYLPVDRLEAFDETLYVLMCGSGVGYSVERQYVNRLPEVAPRHEKSSRPIVVEDSKIGWAEALRLVLRELFAGRVPTWDTSLLRPKGSRLKTMGGRSSGPEPLEDLFRFVVKVVTNAAGRKLTSIECHDIMCQIGECVVVGGVRRSSLISLSNLSDRRMRDAKSGEWWTTTPWRALANNSVAYTERPEVGQFMEEWMSLYNSKSGERGIFNREAAVRQAAKSGRRRVYWDQNLGGAGVQEGLFHHPIDFGCNPCSEILLRPYEFCNLTEIVARPHDTYKTLEAKAVLASFLGTVQSTLTNFRYVNDRWRQNCEEERLLGVSITGIMDCPLLNGSFDEATTGGILRALRDVVNRTNHKWADALGIARSAATTCVKPSGTAALLVGSASGIHPRYADRFIRRVTQDRTDPMTAFMIDAGVPFEECQRKPESNVLFRFYEKTPPCSITRHDQSALSQLRHWKLFQDNWCEHKPSITVYVKEHEWPSVGAWVWDHFDDISGISFLPFDNGSYSQAPFEEIYEDEYQKGVSSSPDSIDWTGISEYESQDNTASSKEFACSSGACTF